ncbi:MAG: fixJ [Proteobacteria bacterium]|nr:fixJ [Pseudomonadota bacterium]
MVTDPTVFIVDDDGDMRLALGRLFDAICLPVELFESAEQFLQSGRMNCPGCLLLDVRMPGMGGMGLLAQLQTLHTHIPVILLTGHGDIAMAVQTLKSGALDFIEKPPDPDKLLDAVRNALAVDRARRERDLEDCRFQQSLAALSQREREVLEKMANGVANKVIALDLGISERTLEKHRKHIMEKMGVRTVAELIRTLVLNGFR